MRSYSIGNMVFDISGTIKDYDFTKRSVISFERVVTSGQFREMDSETIFNYLKDQIEIVSFGDFLKRYIYEGTSPSEPFADLPEEYYVSVIEESFSANRAPHSFYPVKSRWGNIIRRWLRSDTVKRSTVFLLGFGLKMTDQDVSLFLTKVLKEQDFCFYNPEEVVYWYCYHHGLPYSIALSLLQENSRDEKDSPEPLYEEFWKAAGSFLTVYLSNPKKLNQYLHYLRNRGDDPQDTISYEFSKIYERAVSAACRIKGDGSGADASDIVCAYDIESILCSGTPRTASKNLIAVSRSVLSKQFSKKRMSRQHLGRLLGGKEKPDRFDLITLLFMVYAVMQVPGGAKDRSMLFIDEMNTVLQRCGMMRLYPVNPYESFVLMCLLTEDPLAAYNDVWEMSYIDANDEV